MKSVLISIRPKWCELIASGKKTIEVRKTAPKLPTPFKCYIYETKARTGTPTFVDEDGHVLYTMKEYTTALELRRRAIKKGAYYAEKPYKKAKLHRLRIEIQECMLLIERKCGGLLNCDEDWM